MASPYSTAPALVAREPLGAKASRAEERRRKVERLLRNKHAAIGTPQRARAPRGVDVDAYEDLMDSITGVGGTSGLGTASAAGISGLPGSVDASHSLGGLTGLGGSMASLRSSGGASPSRSMRSQPSHGALRALQSMRSVRSLGGGSLGPLDDRFASLASQHGGCGIDKSRFVGQVPKAYCCQLCDNVFNEPVQTPCQHVFCRAGITEKLLAGAWSCPTCSRDVTTAQLKPPSKAIVDYHDALRLRCSNWSSGCRVTTPIREMVEHEEDCAYGTISCMNEGCEVSMLRKDEHAHSDVCAYQQLVCPDCNERMTRTKWVRHNCSMDLLHGLAANSRSLLDRMGALEVRQAESERSINGRVHRLEGVVSDLRTQSADRDERMETRLKFIESEIREIGSVFRVRSHHGSYSRSKPNPKSEGGIAAPPGATWSCCGEAEYLSWCAAKPFDRDRVVPIAPVSITTGTDQQDDESKTGAAATGGAGGSALASLRRVMSGGGDAQPSGNGGKPGGGMQSLRSVFSAMGSSRKLGSTRSLRTGPADPRRPGTRGGASGGGRVGAAVARLGSIGKMTSSYFRSKRRLDKD